MKSDLSAQACKARVMCKGTPGWWGHTILNKDQQRQEGLCRWTLHQGQDTAPTAHRKCQPIVMGSAVCFSCSSVLSQLIPLKVNIQRHQKVKMSSVMGWSSLDKGGHFSRSWLRKVKVSWILAAFVIWDYFSISQCSVQCFGLIIGWIVMIC